MRKKHVPQRTCIACRLVQGKRSLIRLVRVEVEGATSVQVDESGKRGGRGCYLHPNQQCWNNALRSGKIEGALKTKVSVANKAELAAWAQRLPETEELPEAPPVS